MHTSCVPSTAPFMLGCMHSQTYKRKLELGGWELQSGGSAAALKSDLLHLASGGGSLPEMLLRSFSTAPGLPDSAANPKQSCG